MSLSNRIMKEVSSKSALTITQIVNALPKNYSQDMEKLRATLADLDARYKDMSEETNHEEWVDFRLRYLLLQNFRKFDSSEEKFYGCDFLQKNAEEPKKPIENLYLLGSNGVGKSSLVDALEYMFTNRISEADIRKIKNHQWYIKRGNKKSKILISTERKNWLSPDSLDDSDSLKDFRKEYDVRNFFFSENSILTMAQFTPQYEEQNGFVNWFGFFCYLLGLSPIYELYKEGGLLDSAKRYIYQLREYVDKGNGQHKRKELESLLRDSYMEISESQQVLLRLLQEDIAKIRKQEANLSDEEMLEAISQLVDNEELDTLYFFQHFKKDLLVIVMRKNDNLNSVAKTQMESMPKKRNITQENQNSNYDVRHEIIMSLNELGRHMSLVLGKEPPRVSLEAIEKEFETLINSERLETISSEKLAIKQYDDLLEAIELFKTELRKATVESVNTYIDEDFVKTVKEVFTKFLIKKEYENFCLDNSKIADGKIEIKIDDVPVHKYFNTFRYRLFCLTVQAIVNLKVMKHEHFLFPFIFDDVFYANDYTNKAQLFQYFKVVREAAKSMIPQYPLQVLFFTHDELLISCLAKRARQEFWGDDSFARLIEPDVAKSEDMNLSCKVEIDAQTYNFYNLFVRMYESN